MPAWIDAKVVISFCSLVVALGAWRWNWRRSRKRLGYLVSTSPVLQNTKGLNGTIVISYDSGDGILTAVEDVYTARLVIRNSGHQEITKQDFDSPLKFTVQKPLRILSAAIGPCKPEILANHADYSLSAQETLTLSPILLNSKDSISFSLVISGLRNSATLSEKMVCDGRIKGIHQIERVNDVAPLDTATLMIELITKVIESGGWPVFTVIILLYLERKYLLEALAHLIGGSGILR